MSNIMTSRAYCNLAIADPEKQSEQALSPSASTPLLCTSHDAHRCTRAHVRGSRQWISDFPWDKTIVLVFLCSLLVFAHALFGLGIMDAGLTRVRGEFHELHWHPFAHIQSLLPTHEGGESGGVVEKAASVPIHFRALPLLSQDQEARPGGPIDLDNSEL